MLETRALVVEDDLHMRALLRHVVGRNVREVDEAADGRTAMSLFSARHHAIVVLDLKMPGLDGLEVLRRIRALDAQTEVIIVTGFPSKEAAVEALNLNAFRFLEKPFALDLLEHLLHEAFARYSNNRPPDQAPHDLAIESAYREVARLSEALEHAPADQAIRDARAKSLTRLRQLQEEEAEFASRLFRNSLPLKPGQGYMAIETARKILGGDKSSA